MNLVQTEVVSATLEDRERRLAAERALQGFGEAGKVALDQLPLQCDGRRGDHHGVAGLDGVPDRRHEIGQRFTRAGTCLHCEVLAGVDCVGDGGGHANLPVSAFARQCGHGGVEEGGHRRQPGRP
ncbi:Uncharacterised protein [Mycobacteroides abscessus subsp. abscessus]|nr:Uncharacterised protein [Mycobacteroides abscessus subsp. abscessus]